MTISPPLTLAERLNDHVHRKATRLQTRYRNDESNAVADLALLRRGAGQRLGQDARLIPLTVAGLYDNPAGLPDEPQPAELAAFAALTLFAVHQQSHRDKSMHRPGYSFGRSARLLGRHSGSRDAVRARFTALATASSPEERLHHARGLVQQFRAFAIPLDYGRFAVDLLRLDSSPSAEKVRLAWGRDFYRVHHPEDDGDGTTEAADTLATEN